MECAREHPPRLEDSNRWPNLPALPAFRGTHTSVLLDDSMLVHVSSRWDWLWYRLFTTSIGTQEI